MAYTSNARTKKITTLTV